MLNIKEKPCNVLTFGAGIDLIECLVKAKSFSSQYHCHVCLDFNDFTIKLNPEVSISEVVEEYLHVIKAGEDRLHYTDERFLLS